MNAAQTTSLSVVRYLVCSAVQAVSGGSGSGAAEQVVGLLTNRFIDHSQKITIALERANQRAWRSLEIALSGPSWWERLKGKVAPAEEQAFAEQVRRYLNAAGLEGITVDRAKCAEQLRAARQKNLLDGQVGADDLKKHVVHYFARFSDPTRLLQSEAEALGALANGLRREYPHLAALLTLQANKGETLLAIAMKYFFRRALEQDPQLAHGFQFAKLEKLDRKQEESFGALHDALTKLGDRLEGLLDDIRTQTIETHAAVLDLQAEQLRQGEQFRALYDQAVKLQNKLDMIGASLRPQHSMSIRNDEERQLVKKLVAEYRSLPAERRSSMPALLNGLGKLEAAAGDLKEAEQDFRAVAQLVKDPLAQGEAFINAYRAALEQRALDTALRQLQEAIRVDAKRFAPFPDDKYEIVKILGAGGFGVAFLCQHRILKNQVVVKSLFVDHLDRAVDSFLEEASVLLALEHPNIIRLKDCGFVHPETKSKPYLIMDYFEGKTLEEYCRTQPLEAEEFLDLAKQIVAGLQEAHAHEILHRDIKPANILVRKVGEEWKVKLIDFGLAVSQSALQKTQTDSKTLTGSWIAGTMEYAAPEQMGKRPGEVIGRYSDVYGFAKTCCYALFNTTTPLPSQWKRVQPSLVALLERCLEENPQKRPRDFAEVAQLLNKVRRRRQRVDTSSASDVERQIPLHLLAPEFAEINLEQRGRTLNVTAFFNPTMEGAKSEGWQTGVALDGSTSMRKAYGAGFSGQVPPADMKEYAAKGWVLEKVEDGRRLKYLQPAAQEDAIRRGLLQPTPNVVQPLARDFIGLLAERLDADGGTTVIYWACGDGSKLEVLGDFNAQQCRTLALTGPKLFGGGTQLLPALRYFVDRFHDASKGIYVFLADGNFEDLAEVKQYTRDLARAIADGKRNFVKCVLVGVGDRIDASGMAELDDLETDTDVDIWDHKLARDMRSLNDIFAELVDENQIVAPTGKVFDSKGKVAKSFPKGLPGKIQFKLPAGSTYFELELPGRRIKQSLVE